MTYNFRDDPSPTLPSVIDPTGGVALEDGSPQGDLLTSSFGGSQVSVSIEPPSGWSLDSVIWDSGGSGTFDVPPAGTEEAHDFTYTVSQNGSSKQGQGTFKLKKQN